MKDYELKAEKNKKRNEKYLEEFENWLKDKQLTEKITNKHIRNVEFYLNEYLNYYDIIKMEDGVHDVYSYFNGWFIEKCLWATKSSIKNNASSIKKFYQCMSESNHISTEDFKSLSDEIKENMNEFMELMDDCDNGKYYDIF